MTRQLTLLVIDEITMSIDSDFFFNLPENFTENKFALQLDKNLGIKLPNINDYGVRSGNFLGMEISFDPDHGLEDEGDCKLTDYCSRIGLTGCAGDGPFRIIQLHQMVNIALVLSLEFLIEGLLVHELGQRIVRIGYNHEYDALWNYDENSEITSYASFRHIFDKGVDYARN